MASVGFGGKKYGAMFHGIAVLEELTADAPAENTETRGAKGKKRTWDTQRHRKGAVEPMILTQWSFTFQLEISHLQEDPEAKTSEWYERGRDLERDRAEL